MFFRRTTCYTLPLQDLECFLQAVIDAKLPLIAPVKTDIVRFRLLRAPEDLYLKKLPTYPLKGYFFRQKEKVFSYMGSKIQIPKLKARERVFFGVRRCDLNAVAHQDRVFLEGEHKDPYYAVQREKCIFIGYHCNTPPHKHCFCGSMDLKDSYDLMFFKKRDHYLVHIGSKRGRKFLKPFLKLFTKSKYQIIEKDRKIPGTDLLKKKDIGPYFDHKDWQKGVDDCISCTACTALCPTCYCHECHDKPSLIEPGSGERVREWSSCQLQSFSRVAGDHVFRKSRLDRFKHRIYHQLQYFKEKNGVHLCTGCGRCIRECPTRIDFVALINGMREGK